MAVLRLALLTLLLLPTANAPPPDPIQIAVSVTTPAGMARVDTDHPAATRPAARLKKGQAVSVRWFVRNRSKEARLPESVFHFLITRIDKPGQELPREPAPGSLADNSYAADLPVNASTSGTAKIPIEAPGLYLVQFEILSRAGARQQYCGIEVQVE